MREDWPHLDILANKPALLGTDARLELIEAVLFDVRRRVEELNERVSSDGKRLPFVEGNSQQPTETGRSPFLLQLNAKTRRQFPAPPVDNIDSLHEDVTFLRNSLEEDRLKWKQEILTVEQRLDCCEKSNKLFTESHRVQQSVLSSCVQQCKNSEDMSASIQKLTDAEVEIRRRLEASVQKLTAVEVEVCRQLQEIQHSIESGLVKQRAMCDDQIESPDTNPCDEPMLAKDVDSFPHGRLAKLLHDVKGMPERKSLDACVEVSAHDGQDRLTADKALVNEVHCMKLAIATLNRSVSNVAKDVIDLRATEVTVPSATPLSLDSTVTQGGMLDPKPGIPDTRGSSVVEIYRPPEKAHVQETSAAAAASRIQSRTRSPCIIRQAGNWLRPECVHAKEDLASNASSSVWSVPRSVPRFNTDIETLSNTSSSQRSPHIRPEGPWIRPGRAHVKEDVASNTSTSARSVPPLNIDAETPSALSCHQSPRIRPPGTWIRPGRAHVKEDMASNASTSARSVPPLNTDAETLSDSSCDGPRQIGQQRLLENRVTTARDAVLKAVPEYPQSEIFGARTVVRRPFAGNVVLQPRMLVQPRSLAHPYSGNLIHRD